MPPKRQSPLESNPPLSSSSDEESEVGSGSEEEEQPTPTPSTPKPYSDSDSSDEESEEEQDPKTTNLAEESDEESGSESECEPVKHTSEAPRNPPVAPQVKPISSKPMSKKPAASATPAKAVAGAKRSMDEEDEKNRKKKKVEDGGEEEKKVSFQRVFSPEDEIILLNSLIDFKKAGHNYATDMGGFLNFVKDSLKTTVNKSQLQNKIQRLEKKFRNNAGRGKDGKDPVISNPHEMKSYQLSKVIWGDNGAEVTHLASAAGKRETPQVKSNGIASPKRNAEVGPVEEEEDDEKEEDGAGGLEYPYLSQSMQNDPVLPQGLAGLVAKKGWDLMGASNAEALDKKWKYVLIAETKAYLQRIAVVR